MPDAKAHPKGDEIKDLLSWLGARLGQSFAVVDHWEVDPSSIGVAATDDSKQLIYISCFGRPTGRYFVELETESDDGPHIPYVMVGRFDNVDREQLLRIITEHLRSGSS